MWLIFTDPPRLWERLREHDPQRRARRALQGHGDLAEDGEEIVAERTGVGMSPGCGARRWTASTTSAARVSQRRPALSVTARDRTRRWVYP